MTQAQRPEFPMNTSLFEWTRTSAWRSQGDPPTMCSMDLILADVGPIYTVAGHDRI